VRGCKSFEMNAGGGSRTPTGVATRRILSATGKTPDPANPLIYQEKVLTSRASSWLELGGIKVKFRARGHSSGTVGEG
jgi:hypothetical protein